MNFPGKFHQGVADAKFDFHVGEDVSAAGGRDKVIVPDAHLLFSGEYERSGNDLIISDHDHRTVVHDYFRGQQRPALVSSEGATVDPKIVDALTGHVDYAQAAGTNPAGKVVGHVAKLTGSASIVRNGVTVELNNGDAVYQSDVVQTGSGSTIGLVMIDGTTFNLAANARLMLNDLTFDATSTSNTSLFTLMQGAASFVAGQVAKTGDMKVGTPVATVGIRGTAVNLDISASDGTVSVSVIDQHDNQIHAVQVYNLNGDLIGTASSNGSALTLTPLAGFNVGVQEVVKTPADLSQEFSTFQQDLNTYDTYKAIAPNTPPPSDGKRGDVTPQSTTKFAGSSVLPTVAPSTSVLPDTSSTKTQLAALSSPDITTLVNNASSSTSAASVPVQTPSTSAPLLILSTTAAPVFAITSSGGPTNQANQTISGTVDAADAGATVTILDGTTAIGSGVVQSNGSFNVPITLISGSNAVIAQISDAAGKILTSNAVIFTLSTTPPTVTEALAIETGSSAGGHLTSNDALSGSGLANTVVHFTIDGSAIATTVTANAQGQWSFTPSGLADGAHTIVASQTDSFGNTGTASLSFTLDTTAPLVAIGSSGGATNQASQTITGTVDAADAGAAVTILDGTAAIGSAVVQPNGSFSVPVTLSSGSNSLTAQVTDAAGNTGSSSAVVYTLSTTGPTVTEALAIDTGSSGSDRITSNDALSGSGLANTVVHFTIDGSAIATTVTTNAQGQWSFTPSGLADGAHTIVASQTDAFGNTGTASLSFTLDTTAPLVAITSSGGATNQAAQTITGTVDTADAGTTVTLFDNGSTTALGTATVGSDGNWSTGVTLSGNGSHSIVARDTDAAGNTGSSSAVVYTLSTTGPTVTEALTIDTGSSASDHITSNDALSGSGLANTVVHFTIDGSAIATTVTANAQGAWSFTPSGLSDGAHTVVASQTDSFGNTGTASLSFTLDTTAPVVAIGSSGGATNQAALIITGTVDAADAGTTVTLFDNGSATALGTATVGSDGSWSTGVTLSGNGSHSIVARDTDAAGNTGSSSAVVYNLSTTGPTVTEALTIDTGSSGSDHITSNDALSGSGLANTVVHFTIDGSAIATTVTANAQGAWSFTPSGLADGAHTVVASQTDSFGNTGTASLSFTLDTTAPVVAIGSSGGATNQAALIITGTVDAADAGTTVTLFDNGSATALGTATVGSDGSWSTGVTLSGNGSHSIVARDTDAAGNTGSSSAVVYNLSTTGPTVTEALTIDTGSSASDHITSNDALSGSGLANTVVHFTIDGSAIATTVTANAQGQWSFTPSGLSDGAHTIVASQTDAFGNTGTASLSFTLDTTAPLVAITSSGGPVNQASQTITGTVDVADAGATVTILDGTTAIGSAVVQPNGSFSIPVTLSSGSNSLTAQVSDLAGNSATSSAVVFTLSTTAPTVTEALTIDTGSSGSDHITANDALSGSGLANTVVHFTVDGSAIATTVTANAQGAWSFTPTGLADGAHTIVASQTDAFGNTGTASLSFTLDTTAPVVAITSPGGPVNQSSQTITGTVDAADAGATVTILDGTTAVGSAIVQGNGSWTATGVTLSSGSNALTAQVTDAAGNTATSSAVVFTLSTTAPTVSETLSIDTGSSASDHVTSNDALSGSGLANTVVHFTIDGSAIATTVTANAQGAWSFTPSGLSDGAHTIVASQTDAFGNTGSASLSFTLDTTAPVVAITSSGGPVNQASQTITGTVDAADAGSTVTLFDNGTTAVGSAIVQGNGSWTATGVTLSSGSNALTAQVTDAAGNTGTSGAVVFNLSTTAPTVTEALSIDTGSSASDHITSNDALSGSGLANTVVHFTIDGSAIATTVTADGNGAWSFTPSGLADGAHTIVASQTDTFGNTGTASLSFTLDTTAPLVAISSSGGPVNQASQTITGTVDVADAGATVTILDGTTAIGSAVVQPNGSFSIPVTLGSGSNSLTAQVSDLAGNSATSSAVVFTLSTTAPTVTETLTIDTGSSASDHLTSNDALSGSGLANTVVHFTIDGSAIATTVTANAQGQWSFTPSGLSDGAHTIVASQTDTFGNTGTASLSFTLDTTAPLVAIGSSGGATNQASQTITGAVDVADAGTTVTLFDNGSTTALGTATVGSDGSWSTGVTLSGNGSHSIVARDTDAAGNTGRSSAVVYTLSTTGPTVSEALTIDSGSSASDHITSNDALNGTGLANTVVHFTIDGSAIATTVTANAQGAWSFTPSGLSDGAHTIVASQTDAFGNTGTASLSFTLDTTAPLVAIGNPGGATNQPSLAVTGTIAGADAGTTIAVFDGATQVGVATISGGTWSANVTLSNGSNVLTAQVSDAAGNTATSGAVTYTLNTTAPTGGTPVLTAASDSGTSHTDDITDVTAPGFTVALGSTVVAGDTVQLLLGGSALAHPVTHTVTAADITAGSVSLTVTAGDLGADGSKQISAQFSNSFGNSSTTAALTITLDTTAPSGGTPALAAASDSGTSHTDGITDVTAPSFTVALNPTVAAGDTVQLLLGGSALAHPVIHTITAADITAGSVSLTVTAGDLGVDGSKSITAQFSDLAGNSSTTAADVITLDTTAPVVAIGNPGGATNQPSLAVTGTIAGADAGTTIAVFDGATEVGVATISGGTWSANVTLSNGSNVLTAQVSDAAGNTATSGAVTYTLNTTAPTGGTPVLTAASDSGTSHTDDITDVTAPGFTVALGSTVVAGDTVQLLLGGSALAHPVTHTITAADITAGSVSLTVTAGDLGADGSKQISAQFSDSFGNSSTTAALTITLDITAPSGGTPALVAASDSGTSHTDGITDVTAPSFTVALNPTVVAGDTVQLLLGGSALAHPVTHTITAADITAGSVSLTVTAGDLGADGSKSITAQFSDLAGNSSTTAADVITLDTTAPVVAIGNPGGATNQPSLAVTGTIAGADAGTTIAVFDGATEVGVATISGGTWSANVTLSNGSNVLTAQVSDAAGNTATSGAVTYTLNTTAPTGGTPVLTAASDSGTSHTDDITDVTAPGFTVALGSTVVAGDTVQLLLGGSALAHPVTHTITAADITAGSVSLTVTAGDLGADGSKQISAQFSDSFGNSSTTAALTITLDITAPSGGTPALVAASDSGTSHTDGITDVTAPSFTVALNPTVVAGDTVQLLLGGSALAHPVTHTITAADIAAGSVSLTVTAGDLGADGSKSITAQFSDLAGNSSTTAALSFTLDTTAPVVAITSSGGATNQAAQTITGTVDTGDAGTTVTLFDNGSATALGTATVGSNGSWSTGVTLSGNGSHSIVARDTDVAGNTGSSSAVVYTLTVTPNGWAHPNGGSWNVAANWSSGAVPVNTADVSIGPIGTAPYVVTIAPGTAVSANSLTLDDPDVTLLDEGMLTIAASLLMTAGAVEIENGGTLSLGGSPSLTVDFAGTGGNLILGTSPGFTGTINAISTADGAVTITGSGSITTTSGDAIDLSASGGTPANPSNLTLGLLGAITGAAVGVDVVQNGVGNIAIATTGPVVGAAGQGILAEESATGVGSILIDGSGNVTGLGDTYSGIVAENLNAANGNSVTVNQIGNIIGGYDGIRALTDGTGNVTVIVNPGTVANPFVITGLNHYGIEAVSNSTGSISVTTSANDFIVSGSVGIDAYNQATSIPQQGGVTTSNIIVTAAGTINSGFLLTGSSSRPAGILAGYRGGTTNTPNAAVFGNVAVNNSADIIATGGDGIRAYTYGSGNVTVQDLANTTIVANDEYGISASSYGNGSVSVSTVAGDVIDSGASGLVAVNLAMAISSGANSTVSVMAAGTINSGMHLNASGSQPQGISAGYYPGNTGAGNTNVNGTVNVDNFANVTAAAGWGIDAYSFGNGSVTVTDEAGTSVVGAQYGIAASSNSAGSGSVTINVAVDATISAGALYGNAGIVAVENNAGNIKIITAAGDFVSSGGSGIEAINQATTASSASQISIQAAGTVTSGYNGGENGIYAEYSGGLGTVNASVAGNIVLDSAAVVSSPVGDGIALDNWGIGNITATLESSGSITADIYGVAASAKGGGNVSITNKGAITVTAVAGIHAQTGTGILNGVSGIISINNSGAVSALGSAIGPVIEINNGSTQSATFTNTNTGTVTANLLAETTSSVAIADYNGSITVNNSGTISGNAQLATATFNNNAGGVWNVRGSNSFGSGANAINNAGIINIAGASSFSAAGSLAFNNSGTVNVKPNSSANIRGAVTGTFSIGDRSQLELGSSVAAGQVSFTSGNGLLTLDSPSTFNATIAGLAVGDIINLLGITASGASINGSNLGITEVGGPTLSYQVTGTFTGTAFNVLSGNLITLVPTSATNVTGSSTPTSFAPSTPQFYVLSNDSISGAGTGFNVTSSDSAAGDKLAVEINQTSTISVSGAFNGVNLTTTGANVALMNAGTIASSGGIGIFVNLQGGSADVIDYGNVTGNQIGIDVHTSGPGPLNIVVVGATITGTTSYGILAIATAGSLDVTTLGGATINSASVGILAQNQGSSVPLANSSSISISTSGFINSGSTLTDSGKEPAGILAGYLGGTSAPPSIPNPPISTVFGNVSVQNGANINAAAGPGIATFNYGVGDISVSDGPGAIITATKAGATASGFTQYGISAFNYGSGKTTVTTDFGATINSGGTGINAGNQATAVAASAASTVSVVSFGTINSGANLDNSGSTPAGISAGFSPNDAGLFNANVAGNVLIGDSGIITAAAGDGVRGYNYGVGNIEIDSAANITALVASTSTGRKTPYGIGAFNYGPGDVVITTSSASVVHAGGCGVNVSNQATSIAAGANSVIAITTAGSITSGTILNSSGSQPGGIQVGYLGGTTGGAANTNVNGTVIVNNEANIAAAGGWGIDAYNYGNGNVTVDDAGGTTVSGALDGIAGYAESGGTGNLAISVGSNATITGTSTNGILAFSTDAGNISVITSTNDFITSGSTGINVVNEAAAIAAAVGSSITVTAYGTINSGTALTGTGSPPAGITAGYLGGSTIPTVFPLTGLNGDVVVNNFATINAAGGDGIRAYNFGNGDVTVNDEAGSITLGGADPVNGYDIGISAVNEGTGSVVVSTVAGILIDSRNGSSGIAAVNKAPAPSPGSAVVVPSTSHVSVLAYGTIESGTGLTGSGNPAAGIIAGYNPNNTDTPNSNVQGSVWVDDYASIVAPAGTDGIRGFNYGTGTVSILAEAGAVITAGRYAIGAFGFDGGDVMVTNYATLTGGTAAIDATSTSVDPVVINNYGNITGDVLAANAAFDNEAGAVWNLAGASTFATGTNVLINAGTIDTTGASSITSGGSLSVTNTGTVNVQSGSLDIAANVNGTGAFTIAAGATLEFGGSVGAGETISFLGSTGILTLDHSETSPFSGQIANLTGTLSTHDSIDLADMVSTLASAHYVANTTNPTSGVLTVSDGSGHTETFNLVNYTGSGVFTTTSDGAAGTLVFDPPAAAVATDLAATRVISADAQASPSGVDGNVTFAAGGADGVASAGFTPDHGGAGYIGSFSVDPVMNSNGQQSVGWHFALDAAQSDQIAPSQVLSQSYQVALLDAQQAKAVTQEVTILTGGANGDTFNFKPGMGAAIVTNFSEQAADKIDLHESAIANFAQLQAAMQPVHDGHDTLLELNHGDTLTLANISVSQLHANNFIFA